MGFDERSLKGEDGLEEGAGQRLVIDTHGKGRGWLWSSVTAPPMLSLYVSWHTKMQVVRNTSAFCPNLLRFLTLHVAHFDHTYPIFFNITIGRDKREHRLSCRMRVDRQRLSTAFKFQVNHNDDHDGSSPVFDIRG